eukprot:350059_1
MGCDDSKPEQVDTIVKVAEYPDATMIKVSTVPYETYDTKQQETEDGVRTLLKDCGTILEMCFYHVDRSLEADRVILITFETKEQANNAIELNNPNLNDIDIVIELADTDGYIPGEKMKYINQKLEIAKYGYWVSAPVSTN